MTALSEVARLRAYAAQQDATIRDLSAELSRTRDALLEAEREREALLRDDALDRILDDLVVAAGGQRGFTSPRMNVARWDLKAALRRELDCAPSSSPAGGEGDDERVERAAVALSRFVFPGYFVPRHEMASAALAAADDRTRGWLDRLPAKQIAVGKPTLSSVGDRLEVIERLLQRALHGGDKMKLPARDVQYAADWMTVADARDELRKLLAEEERAPRDGCHTADALLVARAVLGRLAEDDGDALDAAERLLASSKRGPRPWFGAAADEGWIDGNR